MLLWPLTIVGLSRAITTTSFGDLS